MWKYTAQVDGMMCGMCESHVNDAVRKAFPVKKVTSSRSKKETTVIAETDLDKDALRAAKDDIVLIANREGLTAHANAITVRFEDEKE